MTIDNFFLFSFANSGFSLLLGLLIIPLFSLMLSTANIENNNIPFAIIIFLIGNVIIPIFSIIGMNLKGKFKILPRIIFTIIASLIVIFSEKLFIKFLSNPRNINSYLSYDNDIDDTIVEGEITLICEEDLIEAELKLENMTKSDFNSTPVQMITKCNDGSDIEVFSNVSLGDTYIKADWYDNEKYYIAVSKLSSSFEREDFLQKINKMIIEMHGKQNANSVENYYGNVEKIAGITIKVPKYFDVRKENYSGFEVAYYPETELAKSTIGFKTLLDGVTSEQVKISKDNIVNNWKESFGDDIKVVDYEIDGHYVLTASSEKSGILSKCAAVVNDNDEKIMLVVLTVDPDDVSGYDYANDFDNMVKNVSIPKKVAIISETTQATIENQINNVETTETAPETTKANNYKNSEVGEVVNEYNNEIDKAKSELNNEIDKAADELKDEMGLAGKLFGGYVDEYADIYKDAVNDFSDIYKDAADEYGKIYDDIFSQFGY